MATFDFLSGGMSIGTVNTDSGSARAYRALLGDDFDKRNRELRREAVYAGDWRQVALCDRAEGRDVGAAYAGSIDPDAIAYGESFTPAQARDVVAGVLLDAWLKDEDNAMVRL